ncbi:MAG: LamG-like jellyroll fold domain-containing protein, partial [Blastocatellia bacterium]
MKRRLTLIAMTLVNSLRSSRPTGMRKSLALTLILTLVLVPLLSHRTLLPSAQAQIGTCGGAGRIFQGCPLGGLFEAGLENQAIDQLIALHKLPAADRSRILGWERDKVRALLYGKLLDVIKKAPTSRSADEQTAVDALAARIKQKRLEAAQYAIDEYNKWDASPCAYAPPTGFSYNPGAPCYLPLQAFFQGRPDPPKFEEFQAYGVARAYNELNSPDAQRVAAASARAAQFFGGVAAAGIAGAIGVAIAASLPQTAIAVIFPFAFGIASSTFAGSAGVAGGATAAATGLTSATVALGGAVAIVVVAIVIGVLRGIDVFNAAAIPGKLQETKNNVMNTAVDLAQVITTEHGQQEVYAMFIVMTLPDFLSSDPVPAQQASDPKFMLQRSGSPTTADYLLRYKSWDNADQTARLNGGWFINKDAGGKEVWTLSIDYLDWNGEQWTASRSGTNFIHTKEGAADRTFESPQIKYKDWSGINFTASLGVTALEIDALPVVLNRGHINPNDKFDPDPFPQTLPVALVNSAGQALNTLSVMVNDAASAATTGVTIANLSVDSAGQVTASLAATCAASSATFMLKVTDSQGQSKTTPLVIYLTPIYGAPRNPLPATLPDGKVGVPYGAVLMPDLIVACNARATIHHTGGKLPFGLSFGDVRSCSGIFCIEQGFGVTSTPTSGGSSTFTVTMSFSNGDTFSRTYTVNIASDPVEMPAGMVSWWNAEHGVQDIAERNHGQASNGFGPKDFAIGHVGLAFRFNGSSGAVRLPNNFFPFPASGAGNTPFTFETWFKTSSGGVIIGEQSSLPGGAIPSSDSFSPGIYVGMDGKLRARMFSPGVIAPITSDATVNDDRFHHVAVTYDGMEQAVYLDGDEIGRVPHSHPGVDRFYAYQLGTGYTTGWPSANNGWFGFNGLIDEATFFSRALDAQE